MPNLKLNHSLKKIILVFNWGIFIFYQSLSNYLKHLGVTIRAKAESSVGRKHFLTQPNTTSKEIETSDTLPISDSASP